MSMGMSKLAYLVSSWCKYMHNRGQIAQSGSVESCTIPYSSMEIQMAAGHDDKQRRLAIRVKQHKKYMLRHLVDD